MKGLTYKEGLELSTRVKWKTVTCDAGESCWCRGVYPEEEIICDGCENIVIVSTGEINKYHAEYIVALHNSQLP